MDRCGYREFRPSYVDSTSLIRSISPPFQKAQPLMEGLEFNASVAAAIRHAFGRTLLVRNIDAGAQLAKQVRLDCVTPEGN